MSANSDYQRTDDEIVALLSQWLMKTLGNDALDTEDLAPGQRVAVEELMTALAGAFPGETGGLEMVVRETIEALAYGE